jgi:hypothetical protein
MSIPDTPMSSLLALLQNAEQTPPLKLLMEQWLLAHPVSDILTNLRYERRCLKFTRKTPFIAETYTVDTCSVSWSRRFEYASKRLPQR